MKTSLRFFGILMISATAFADKPTPKEYWAKTEMNFQFLVLNFLDCSGQKLVACVQALNAGAEAMDPPAVFATAKEEQEKSPALGKKLKDFGPLSLYELVIDQSKSSLRQKLQRVQQIQRLQIAGAQELVKSGVDVDIAGILDATQARMLGKDASIEPWVAGRMANAYFASAFDPHTHLDPAQEDRDMEQAADDSVSGIGAVLSITANRLVIAQVQEGSPALAAGLRPKDVILSVDGDLMAGKDMNAVVGKVRGPVGSIVTLVVQREGKEITVKIKRETILIPNVRSKLVDDAGRKMGYIKFNSFMDESGCDKIKSAIASLTHQGAKALILDLRGNGGGRLDQATCIGSLFLGKKLIVEEKTVDEKETLEKLHGTGDAVTDLPMVTLIDSASASASEILAGALQDYQRSLILGETSFGKATVQAVRPVTPNLNIAATIARFYQPSGRTNQVVGIQPDIALIPFPGATEDDLFSLHEADLYTNAFPALGAPWVEPRPKLVAKIKACMRKGTVASRLYKQRQNDALPPDYRLLAAEEALVCAE